MTVDRNPNFWPFQRITCISYLTYSGCFHTYRPEVLLPQSLSLQKFSLPPWLPPQCRSPLLPLSNKSFSTTFSLITHSFPLCSKHPLLKIHGSQYFSCMKTLHLRTVLRLEPHVLTVFSGCHSLLLCCPRLTFSHLLFMNLPFLKYMEYTGPICGHRSLASPLFTQLLTTETQLQVIPLRKDFCNYPDLANAP